MKILFIAPLPPPITGHSVASMVLLEELKNKHQLAVIDMSKASTHDGSLSFRRILAVLQALYQTWKEKRGVDVIYLTISESFFGNIKDLLIYAICFNKLSRCYIHLHGGSIKRLLFDVHPVMKFLNSFCIKRMAGAIISGGSHLGIFEGMLDNIKIHIIPNFAQEYLFVDEIQINNKFNNSYPLNVLYLSGMTAGKGYLELLGAYNLLDDDIKASIRLDFAGKFDSDAEQLTFTQFIQELPGVHYHGVVDEAKKRSLFASAHLFCLPTSYLEGQPISILEAYASGNAVMTTGQAGIRDVFIDGVNGFEIEPNNPAAIEMVIRKLLSDPTPLIGMGKGNREIALANYRTTVFSTRIEMVLAGQSQSRSGNSA